MLIVLISERLSVFSFDGRKDQLEENSEIKIIKPQFPKTDELDDKTTWLEIKDSINKLFIQGITDYPIGYLICHDFEGELHIDQTENNIVFGPNLLAKKAVVTLFENIDNMEREAIVEEIDYILQNLAISDFEDFQLTMLKVYHQAYLTKFERNIEILLDLKNRYNKFDEQTKKLIENTKPNKHMDTSKFIDKGHFRFDFAYLQFSLGFNYRHIEKYDLALEFYDKAYELWKSKSPENYKVHLIKCLMNTSSIFYNRYEHSTAIEYSLRGLKLTSGSKNTEIKKYEIMLLNNISIYYVGVQNFDEANEYAQKSFSKAKSMEDSDLIYISLVSLGHTKLHSNSNKALKYFKEAYELFDKTDLSVIHQMNLLFYLILVNFNQNKYSKAIKYFEMMINVPEINRFKIHQDRFKYLQTILSIETDKKYVNNPLNILVDLFYDKEFYLEIRTLVAFSILSNFNKKQFPNIEKTKLKNDILLFAEKHKITGLIDILNQEKIDAKLIDKLILLQIQLNRIGSN